MKGDGDSLTDRLVEIEMHPYFSPHRRPNQVYNEYFFGLDWEKNPERWIYFYAYMLECAMLNLHYRHKGYDLGVKYHETKTLAEKRLLENIPEEFFDFMEEKVYEWAAQGYKDIDQASAISPPFMKAELAQEYGDSQNKKYDTLSVKGLTKFLTFYCTYKKFKIIEAKRAADNKRRHQIIDMNILTTKQ